MAKRVSTTELQKNTRAIIDWTRTKGEVVVVETYGKPMAAILSYDEYQDYLVYRQVGKTAVDPDDVKQRLLRIGRECAALPVLDERTAEEIIGYDESGALR